MRGPLFSGALGSPVTLDRVCGLLQDRQPVVVLSALWLAEALATAIPVVALVEGEKRSGAARAIRRATKSGLPLAVVAAASELPLQPGSVGAILLESLVDIEDEGAAHELLVGLLPALAPGGIIMSLDATKNPELEARVAAIFLAASLTGITQLRPREGALLTRAVAPHPEVRKARACAFSAVAG